MPKEAVFINYREHPEQLTSCAVLAPAAVTIFAGHPECAVPPVRYQGCPRIRVPVGSVSVESRELIRYGLSWWLS